MVAAGRSPMVGGEGEGRALLTTLFQFETKRDSIRYTEWLLVYMWVWLRAKIQHLFSIVVCFTVDYILHVFPFEDRSSRSVLQHCLRERSSSRNATPNLRKSRREYHPRMF